METQRRKGAKDAQRLGGFRGLTFYVLRFTPQHPSNLISAAILLLTTLLGVWAFIYPFFVPHEQTQETGSHAGDAPLVFLLVMVLCMGAIVADLETRNMSSKTVALLGVLVATNSLLRPLAGPGGSSFFYLLPILCGYTFGPMFGFLLGALSLVVSALFTGGVGPWLPFQMLAVGWIGLSSGLLPRGRMQRAWKGRAERWLLAAWGGLIGLTFGAIMNLWFWPYLAADAGYTASQTWQPGTGLTDALSRYAAFYLATSLPYDVPRALGNAALLLTLGLPILRLLKRYRQRFFFSVTSDE